MLNVKWLSWAQMFIKVGFSGFFFNSYIRKFWYFDVSIWSGEKILSFRAVHQQTPTDTARPLKQHLAVSLAVCCCWLMSGDVWRCMWGVWGCLRVCEWYLWMSDSHLCWFWFWWVVFVGYPSVKTSQNGAIALNWHRPKIQDLFHLTIYGDIQI